MMGKKKATSKKTIKKALGKGLDALLPDIETYDNDTNDYFNCDINIISPNRYQPRVKFSEKELEDLSNSIKEQGVIQPLLVRTNDTGYELIAGERRLRAAKMAGLDHVPVVVKDISDTELLERQWRKQRPIIALLMNLTLLRKMSQKELVKAGQL